MKLQQRVRNVETSIHSDENLITLEQNDFTFSQEDSAHLMGILSDRLYSDKIAAVIREYSTNCLDAHIMVGKEKTPFYAHLPTLEEPYFSVRDYGPGLSPEEIKEIYVSYGKSTKRDTNNAVGQLGLGCKSGFAYTDSFMVTSYYGGRKRTWVCFKNEENKNTYTKIDDQPTEEPSGIEVRIEVDPKDVNAFSNKAINIYEFFQVKPESNIRIPKYNKYLYETDLFRIKETQNSYYSRIKHQPLAVMGCVAYPIDKAILTESGSVPPKLIKLLDSDIQIKFPVGALEISASRESLEYTKKTIRSIYAALNTIANQIKEKIHGDIQDAESIMEARTLLSKMTKEPAIGYIISQLDISYKGRQLKKSFSVKLEANNLQYYQASSNQVRRNQLSIWATVKTVFIFADENFHIKKIKYLKNIGEIKNEAIIWRENENGDFAKAEKWLYDEQLDGIQVIKLSDFTYPKSEIKNSNYSRKNNVKVLAPKNKYDPKAAKTDMEIASIPDTTDKVYYLAIDRYKLYNNQIANSMFDIKTTINFLKPHYDIPEYYFIKKSKLDNLPDNFVDLSVWLKEKFIEYFENNKHFAKAHSYRSLRYSSRFSQKLDFLIGINQYIKQQQDSNTQEHIITKYLRLIKEYKALADTKAFQTFMQSSPGTFKHKMVRSALSEEESLQEIEKKINNLYPFLLYASMANKTKACEYITAMDMFHSTKGNSNDQS